MHITRKILIFDGQCNYKKCVKLLKEQLLLIHVYDLRKFSPSFIKFTVIELKVAGFLKPAGFLKQTGDQKMKLASFLKPFEKGCIFETGRIFETGSDF